MDGTTTGGEAGTGGVSACRVVLPRHLEGRRPALVGAAAALGLDEAVVFATSGSSGEPKFVVHDRASIRASADAVNAHLAATSGDVWLRALPGFHVGGFAIRERAAAAGCRFEEWDARWDPLAFVDVVTERAVTLTSLVPTQVHDLVAARLRSPRLLRAVVVGGARLESGLARAARALGWPVLASYGATEAGSQVATQPLEAALLRESASLPDPAPFRLLPGWEARTDEEAGLSIRGPALFRGYLVEASPPTGWRLECPFADGGWFRTSDRAQLVVDGTGRAVALREVSRADTCVKILGEIVALESVEDDLAGALVGWVPRPALVVLAVPDERSGHRLVAVIEAGEQAAGSRSTEARIGEAIGRFNDGTPGFRRIAEGWALESLPRSPIGKVLRPALAEALRTGAARRFW